MSDPTGSNDATRQPVNSFHDLRGTPELKLVMEWSVAERYLGDRDGIARFAAYCDHVEDCTPSAAIAYSLIETAKLTAVIRRRG